MVAALFCGVVVGVFVASQQAAGSQTPPESEALAALKKAYDKDKANEELKAAVRNEDLRLREAHLTARRRLAVGAYLLFVAAVGVVLCAKWYVSLDPAKPAPIALADRPDVATWLGTRRGTVIAVGGTGVALGFALLVFVFAGGRPFPRSDEAMGAEASAARPKGAATAQAPRRAASRKAPAIPRPRPEDQWPAFRGPTGMGLVAEGDWPTTWDGKTGQNILWRTPVDASGKGSPVIWGDRIFVTGGDRTKLEVLCFDRKTGKPLWRTPIKSPLLEPKKTAPKPKDDDEDEEDDKRFKVFESTGYAAATPATDGERVYAVFATADIAALDLDGKIAWHHHLGKPDNDYGMASSLILHKGLVILLHDQGGDEEKMLSALIAFDGKTGKEAWRTKRPVVNSWTTPIIADTGQRLELITSANEWVISYNPDTGAELWRAEGVTGDVAPSPVYAAGLVYATNQYSLLVAIRTGGSGDVTKTHTAWEAEEGMSDASSPICDGKLYLQATSGGLLTCYEATKGSPNPLWEAEMDLVLEKYYKEVVGKPLPERELSAEFWASPALVGNLVYLTAKDGRTYIFPLAEKFKLLGIPNLGEEVFASPAFLDGRIYFRTTKHLVCIAKGTP